MEISNRELAGIVWLSIIFMYCAIFSKNRAAILSGINSLLRIIFLSKAFFIVLLLSLYVLLETYILYKIGFWTFSLLKETLLWAFGSFGLLLSNNNLSYQERLKHIIVKSLTLSVFIEYFVNIFSFSLILELIFTPIIFFVAMIQVIASTDDNHSDLLGIINKILGSYFIFLIFYTIYNISIDQNEINISLEIKKLAVPFLLSILYIPFPYIFFVFLIHENVRTVVDTMGKNKSLTNKVTFLLLKKFKINLFALQKWRESAHLHLIKSEKDISSVISA